MTSQNVPPLASIRKKRTSRRRAFGGSGINVVHGTLTPSNSGPTEQNRVIELRQPADVTSTKMYGGSVQAATISVSRLAREAPQASEIYAAIPSHIEDAEFTSEMIPRALAISPRRKISLSGHNESQDLHVGAEEVRMVGPEGLVAQIDSEGIKVVGHQGVASHVFQFGAGRMRVFHSEEFGPQIDPEELQSFGHGALFQPLGTGFEITRAANRGVAPQAIELGPRRATSVGHEMAHQLMRAGFEGIRTIGRDEGSHVLPVDPEDLILSGRWGAPFPPLWRVFDYPARVASNRRAYLLTFLRHRGQTLIADRIQRYFDVRDQEPDEPPIISESLSSLVSFMVQESNLLPPIIGSDPEGQMEIEWHLRDNGDPGSVWGKGNGVVSLRFLKSGEIHYVALSGPI